AVDDLSSFAPTAPYAGRFMTVQAVATLQPVDRFTLALSWNRAVFSSGGTFEPVAETFARNAKQIVFDVTTARVMARFFLTRSLSGRLIVDYDDNAGTLGLSALASYRPGPGSVLYLGWQQQQP